MDEKKEKRSRPELKEIKLKTSRLSFLSNYCIAALAIIFFIFMMSSLDLQFAFFPKNLSQLFSTLLILGVLLVIAGLIEQPEWVRLIERYTIGEDEVSKNSGLLRRKRIGIPYQSVAHVKVDKGVIGNVLNFGDIEISSWGEELILMKGIRHPDETSGVIREKILIASGGSPPGRRRR